MNWKKIKVLSWNVRGLGCDRKVNVVSDVIRTSRCDFVCLQETKWNMHDLNYYLRLLSSFFQPHVAVLHAIGTAGGCLMAQKREYEMQSSWVTRHMVTTILKHGGSGNTLAVTSVYGPSRDDLKIDFMAELKSLVGCIHVPWILAGDFNLVRWLIDRSADLRGMKLMCLFNDLIRETSLIDNPLKNRNFTWSSKRPEPVFSKLDRVFMSLILSNKFSIITLNALEMSVSDHAPLLLHCRQKQSNWKPFRLENFWLRYPEVKEIIQNIWAADSADPSPANDFLLRTTKLQESLRAWHLANFKKCNEDMNGSKARILELDKKEEIAPLELHEFKERIKLRERVFELANIIESRWR